MYIHEQELKRVREMTIGELLDTLNKTTTMHKREKLRQTLYLILIQARDFYADKNDVCRGALAIATTAIDVNGYPHNYAVKQMIAFMVLLANEILEAKGAGFLPLETLVDLRKIRDTYPDSEDWESWPEKEEITLFPVYQPPTAAEPVPLPQAAEAAA